MREGCGEIWEKQAAIQPSVGDKNFFSFIESIKRTSGIPRCWEEGFEKIQASTYFKENALNFTQLLKNNTTAVSQNLCWHIEFTAD